MRHHNNVESSDLISDRPKIRFGRTSAELSDKHLDRSAAFVTFWWYHQKMRFSHENIRFSYFLMRFFKWFLMKSWEILMFSWENLIFWWYHQNVTKGADRSNYFRIKMWLDIFLFQNWRKSFGFFLKLFSSILR